MSVAVNAIPQGRLRDHTVGSNDCNYGIFMHLSPLAAFIFAPFILAPLLMWQLRKNQSAFVDDHGREAVNAVLSYVVYNIALIISIVGIIALPVLFIIAIVSIIRAAVAASRGEYFRYPMTLRFIS